MRRARTNRTNRTNRTGDHSNDKRPKRRNRTNRTGDHGTAIGRLENLRNLGSLGRATKAKSEGVQRKPRSGRPYKTLIDLTRPYRRQPLLQSSKQQSGSPKSPICPIRPIARHFFRLERWLFKICINFAECVLQPK